MRFAAIDTELVAKLLLLLLTGMSPKLALVPLLKKTKHPDAETQRASRNESYRSATAAA